MRRHSRSGSPYEDKIGFSRAVRYGDLVAVSGTAPVWPGGDVEADVSEQARRCWRIALGALTEVGGSAHHVVRTRQYIVDATDADAVGAVHGEVFRSVRPASTMVVVAALLDPRWKIEVELDAVIPDGLTGPRLTANL
ncbi:RidA family protein [Aeromicrobium sp.]|uniref:RidA family protein n=1 Tax=Aeromicrobium sp. TaxID=1871063 RepID=UPI003D6A89A0